MTGNFSPNRYTDPRTAEPVCSAPAGAPSPRGVPAHSATGTSSQRPNPPRPQRAFGWRPPPCPPRTCSAGRSQGGRDRGSVRAPRAPGAAGRIHSGQAGQTRRQTQPLQLANLQHLPPLACTEFASRAGGGLGAGPLPAGSAPTVKEPEAGIPLEGELTRGGTGLPDPGQALKGSLRPLN